MIARAFLVRMAARRQAVCLIALMGLMAAPNRVDVGIAGGDGPRMASVRSCSTPCLVGGREEEQGGAACVRAVAAGFVAIPEPAALVLLWAVAGVMGLRRRIVRAGVLAQARRRLPCAERAAGVRRIAIRNRVERGIRAVPL